jgi:predicted O-methyltransferase YrrM
MDSDKWTAVDSWFADRLRPRDETLVDVMRAGGALPQIQVSDLQGGFLSVMARAIGARRILEIGTLFGFSTIVLGRTLPKGGHLVTLESSREHAHIARDNIARAGLGDRVEVRLGPALDSLAALAEDAAEPFDLVFVDADKENNPNYWDWALRLTRPGGVVIVDNVVREGRVIREQSRDPDVVGTRGLTDAVATAMSGGLVDATVLQTVGSKGWDGFLIATLTGGAEVQ